MSQLIVDGNEIIPGSIEVTTTNTSITPKDNLQVVLNINQSSSTAVVGSGTDLGMRMSLINKNSNACTVIFGGEGGTVSYTLALNKTLKLVWVGTYWIGTVGGVLSGVDNAGNSFSYNTETVLHAIPQNTQYTTTETDTGMKWLDGKKIYRRAYKVINASAAASTKTIFNFDIINDIDTVITMDGALSHTIGSTNQGILPANHYNSPYTTSVTYISGGDNTFALSFNELSGNVRILNGSVWIEYTKTTD